MALAHHAGIWAWNETKWAQRAAELAALSQSETPDLFARAAGTGAAVTPVEDGAETDAGQEPLVPAVPLAAMRSAREAMRPEPVAVVSDPYV